MKLQGGCAQPPFLFRGSLIPAFMRGAKTAPPSHSREPDSAGFTPAFTISSSAVLMLPSG